jgi:hypothetical protein
MGLSALRGILQNDTASMIIDNRPLLYFLERPEAAETDIIIAEAAISYARGLSGAVEMIHWRRAQTARARI